MRFPALARHLRVRPVRISPALNAITTPGRGDQSNACKTSHFRCRGMPAYSLVHALRTERVIAARTRVRFARQAGLKYGLAGMFLVPVSCSFAF